MKHVRTANWVVLAVTLFTVACTATFAAYEPDTGTVVGLAFSCVALGQASVYVMDDWGRER